MDIVATALRHPSIGETVPGQNLQTFPGGKGANQAVASAKQGAVTYLAGCVGSDESGVQLIEFLEGEGVDVSYIKTESDITTGTALITVAKADNTIVVVPGANGRVDSKMVGEIDINNGDVLLSQFEVPLEAISSFFEKGRRRGAITVLNPAPAKPCSLSLLRSVDVLVLNETELAFLVNESTASEVDDISSAAKRLAVSPDQVLVVTLGAKGVMAVQGENSISIPGIAVDAVDTTGAGDCFVGAFASQLSSGESLEDSLHYANCAAAISVQRHGAGPSMPSREEVVRFASAQLN